MDEITVPIYLITGFLESGKTSFLSFTLQQDYFRTEGKTLLILCEEGEEEYDEEALAKDNVVVEVIEKEEDFTPERLQALDIIHQPERVVMEYNGMWLVSKLANFRRSIKVVNPSAEVIFEDEEGEMTDIFADQMPFDLDAEIVDIPPEDYGIWFVDAMDHPDRYVGKTLRFKARARRPRGMGSKFFIPGRTAMTCCADDTSFLGYICKSAYAPKLKPGEWVEVTAKVAFENRSSRAGCSLCRKTLRLADGDGLFQQDDTSVKKVKSWFFIPIRTRTAICKTQ